MQPTQFHERKDDSDLKECLKYAPAKLKNIHEVLACIPGASDGDDWHYVALLCNGNYVYATGWCDYTGWGCQEGGDGFVEDSIKKILARIKEDDKRLVLKNQLDGKSPYGLWQKPSIE